VSLLTFLKESLRAADCKLIVDQARRREIEIVVSLWAMAEVVRIEGTPDDESEAIIAAFFEEPFVVRAAFDLAVAERARDLVRRYRGLKPKDAVHVATALQNQISILETFDNDLITLLNNKEGNPALRVRHPLYEGTRPLPLEQPSEAARVSQPSESSDPPSPASSR
jgi:predicted nucleic acid-binding protein